MNRKQVLLNALTTFTQELVGAALLFFLYRLLFRSIGAEGLGIWSLVLATTSFLTLANQGFSASIVKYVAKYVAREQPDHVSLLVQTALISIGAALAVACIALYPCAKWILKAVVPNASLAESYAILPFALLSLWINVTSGIHLAALSGHELITHRNYLLLGGSLFYLLLGYLIVPRYGLLGLAYAQTVEAAASFFATWILLRHQMPHFPLIPRRWNRPLFHEMLGYGLNFQLITVCQAMREPVTKALLTKFGGLAMTGYYDLASRWVVNFRELIVQANEVLVPTISSIRESAPDSIPKIYRESYRLIFFLAIPTFAFLVFVSPLVSRIWLGAYEPIFVRFVALLALGWLVNVLSNPAYVVDLGTGALGWVTVGCASTAVLTLVLGVILGMHFGGTAIVAASVASLAFGYVVVVVSHHLENGIPIGVLLPKESVGIALSGLAGALIFLPFFCSAPASSLYSLRVSAGLLIALLTIMIPMWIHPLRKRLVNWVLSSLPV